MIVHGRHAPAREATAAPDEGRPGLVLAAAAVSMFVIDLDFFALNLALPGMARDLDVSTTDLQWVISATCSPSRPS